MKEDTVLLVWCILKSAAVEVNIYGIKMMVNAGRLKLAQMMGETAVSDRF